MRVVVTGMGVVSPLGLGSRAVFDRWAAGEVAIADGLARCSEFEPGRFMTGKEQRRSDRFTQLAVAAAAEAVEQADVAGVLRDNSRAGVAIGNCFGALATEHEQLRAYEAEGASAVSPRTIPMCMSNAPPAAIAIRYGARGPARMIGTACAAGADAIGAAFRMIRHGEADVMLAGGTEAAATAFGLSCTLSAGAGSPSGRSRPFDVDRDGFVLGEGAAVLVLERADLARERGAVPVGEILGYGTTTDAYHVSAPDPEGAVAAEAIRMALQDAGLEAEDVDYVNAHGTGTPLNDAAETKALKRALGSAADRVPISSTKSVIGHLVGAAGAVEAAVTIEALAAELAPPNAGLEVVDPELDLHFVADAPERLARDAGRPLVAVSNSFGFGGHNAVLCLADAVT